MVTHAFNMITHVWYPNIWIISRYTCRLCMWDFHFWLVEGSRWKDRLLILLLSIFLFDFTLLCCILLYLDYYGHRLLRSYGWSGVAVLRWTLVLVGLNAETCWVPFIRPPSLPSVSFGPNQHHKEGSGKRDSSRHWYQLQLWESDTALSFIQWRPLWYNPAFRSRTRCWSALASLSIPSL